MEVKLHLTHLKFAVRDCLAVNICHHIELSVASVNLTILSVNLVNWDLSRRILFPGFEYKNVFAKFDTLQLDTVNLDCEYRYGFVINGDLFAYVLKISPVRVVFALGLFMI